MTSILAFLTLLTFTPDLTQEEVKRLAAAGLSDDVIVSYVHKHGPITPALSPDDLIALRQAQVSEKVLAALLESPQKMATQPSPLPSNETYPPPVTVLDPGYEAYLNEPYYSPFYGRFGWTFWPRYQFFYYDHRDPYRHYPHYGGLYYQRPYGGYWSYPNSTHPQVIRPHGSFTTLTVPRGHR